MQKRRTGNGPNAPKATIVEATVGSPSSESLRTNLMLEFQTIASIAETILATNDVTSARSLRLMGHGVRGTVG